MVFLVRVINRLRNISAWCRNEIHEWFRAFLRAIPGEIGIGARALLYGFKHGRRTRVLSNVIIRFPSRVSLGDDAFINAGCQLNGGGGIEIGANVLIGPGVLIWSMSHNWRSASELIGRQQWKRAKVIIEEDVWIGAGAIILPGVRLARGTVVAAGAVVTKSTQPYSLVAGVPAHKIAERQGVVDPIESPQATETVT